MGLIEKMRPHIKSALLEIPVAYRQEVSDAMVVEFDFEGWRVSQDPEIDDTPANRAEFIAEMMARRVFQGIKNVVYEAREKAATGTVHSDLDS